VTFVALVALIEAAVIIALAIDNHARPAEERQFWPVRWLWWHLAPLWLLWLALISVLMTAAVGAARRSYERHQQRRTVSALLLAAADES